MLVYPVSLIQQKNQTDQTDQSNQSTLLYRKHGSCYLYYSLLVELPVRRVTTRENRLPMAWPLKKF